MIPKKNTFIEPIYTKSPIDEQKIILNLKNNLEHKPITAGDIPGVNRIGLLPDDTLHFEYDPIKVYGKRPDMIDNTIGMPTKGLDKTWNAIGGGLSALMASPILIHGAEVMPAVSPAWIAKNVVIPMLGGELVDEVTRKVSNNYYEGFGDWLYRSTPLEKWTKDTWLENPTRFIADGANPGYWAPYGQLARGIGQFIDDGVRTAKTITTEVVPKTVDNLKTIRVQSPVYVTEEVVAPVTSSGVAQTPEYFASSWGWRSPIYRKSPTTPTPASTPTPNPASPVVEMPKPKIEGAEYTLKKPLREMTKRGVKVDPKYNKELKDALKNSDKDFIDAFAAEARKYYDETGEIVSSKNVATINKRANDKLIAINNLRNDIHSGGYINESGETINYTREELNNLTKELKTHTTEMSYLDPNAQRLNWFSQPITNTFSPKPAAWNANHPYLKWLERSWPLWGIGSATVWGRDLWNELPEALEFLFVRPEESKQSEVTEEVQSEPTYNSDNLRKMIEQRDAQQSKIDSLNNAR